LPVASAFAEERVVDIDCVYDISLVRASEDYRSRTPTA
jgi:hypothetical protein